MSVVPSYGECVVPKNLAGEVAASTSAAPEHGTESTFARSRQAALRASEACEAVAKGDADTALQRIEETIRELAGVVRDYGLDLIEVLPQEQCPRCSRITADLRTNAKGQAACLKCSDEGAERVSVGILSEARTTIGDRGDTYGDSTAGLERVAGMWSILLETNVAPREVATMLALLKIVRTTASPTHRDSYVDAAAYMGLAIEAEVA